MSRKSGVAINRSLKNWLGVERWGRSFQGFCPAFEQDGQLSGATGVCQVALQIVERHVRIGTARQDATKGMTQLAERLDADDAGQVLQVALAALEVAEMPMLQHAAGPFRGLQAIAQTLGLHIW